MKNRNLMLLALAIGCGLVAAFLTARLSAGGNKTEMVGVLVASRNIDQGTKLDEPEKLFVRKPFPRESVPPEFIDDVAQLKGKVINRTIRAGAHCTLADLKTKDSIDLPVGTDGTMYKGMAIRVSQATAVSGFIQPGDRVDVMVIDHPRDAKATSTLLLQNVLVVAINEIAIKPDGTSGAIKNATTVTLAVKQKEALILSLAQAKGEINLMLRSKDDQTVINKGPRVISDYDNRDDNASSGTTNSSLEVVKIPVAKRDLPAGTRIEDPSDYFEEKEVPEVVLAEHTVRTIAALKGKTVTKYVYKDYAVPQAAFEGDVPKLSVDQPPPLPAGPGVHTLTIQVGTSSPQFVKYDENGKLLEGGQWIGGGASPRAGKADKNDKVNPGNKPEDK